MQLLIRKINGSLLFISHNRSHLSIYDIDVSVIAYLVKAMLIKINAPDHFVLIGADVNVPCKLA